MTQTKAPKIVRKLLDEAIGRLKDGPAANRVRTGESEEFLAGMEEQRRRYNLWLRSWVIPPLEHIALYLAGDTTANQIEQIERRFR